MPVPHTGPGEVDINYGDESIATVTGASSGLGFEIARALAMTGVRVALVCRDSARGASARENIARSSPSATLDLFVADLSSLSAVRRLAAEMRERLTRLDVLVNNAGVVKLRREETVDGLEWTLSVNHLAPFLLTRLLMPLLEASRGSRVVNVSSDAHRGVTLDVDDLQSLKGYDAFLAYQRTKLANVLFTYALSRRVAGNGISVFAVAPGMAATEIVREAPPWYRLEWSLKSRPASEGAATPVWAALAPELSGKSGLYLRDGAVVDSSPESYDVALQERLWVDSMGLTG
ncbi:MAG: SDR family NAD(P)-dependent oxidoreductase [Acidobacteriota bacterium]|nr:SDR family NAD(P)-dependent oxidoreductase [Acidobacteriota bacterium]